MSMRKIAGLLFIAAWTAGCAQQEEAPVAEGAVPVEVAEAERGEIRQIVTADGILYPINQAALTPKISAPIRALHANRGDRVTQGQVIAELESRDLAAASAESKALYVQAEGAFQSATAATLPDELNKADREADAAKQAMDAAQKVLASRQELLRQGALAQRLVDEANSNFVQAKSQYDIAQTHLESVRGVGQQAAVKNAQGQLEAAKAGADAAEVQLSYSQIVSPIDGVVSDRPLYVGEMASAGMPLLTVMDTSRMIARAKVPSSQLQLIRVGDAAMISISAGSEFPGRVTVISPALDPNSTTAEVWVEAANPGGQLHPGATARVSIVVDTVKDAVLVPASALLPSPEGKTMVLAVDAESVAHEREIEVGVRETDKVQIAEGLEPGDKVVIAGGLGVEDGAKVEVKTGEK